MKELGLAIVLGILLVPTIQATTDIFDFSNLDWSKFRFFRNLPSQNPATAPYANPVLEHFQKKKAVLDYLDRLLLGNSLLGPPTPIEFHPNYGKAWRPYFEHHYGRRAERLIELLGSGASVDKLKYHGVLPQDFGSYH
ncbi:uncharacterized protein LOC129951322 [Eupeodes corollae]|uniref:uncharacterized protein LOC129951322 n=1 Tax=Eupeodes corollae TaxID=290404 RepID=UPI0024904106|nr:uncharacterized protein LOC129951322 [Eupeodes corollae]